MTDRRPRNSELHLQKLEEEESKRDQTEGILELFPQDEDAPLTRDDEDQASST
jgi:hypothetical protein